MRHVDGSRPFGPQEGRASVVTFRQKRVRPVERTVYQEIVKKDACTTLAWSLAIAFRQSSWERGADAWLPSAAPLVYLSYLHC